MELKQKYRNQNLDLPIKFLYHYQSGAVNLTDILVNFSGLNENLLIKLIKSVLNLNTSISTDYFVSDTVLKIMSLSENLRNSISSHVIDFKVAIDSKHLKRLLKTKIIKLKDLIRINNLIKSKINDFDCFNADSDFVIVESLTGKTISDLVIININSANTAVFKTFVKIRKALHYILKTDRESLKKLEFITIIEFLKKETPEEIENLLKLVPIPGPV